VHRNISFHYGVATLAIAADASSFTLFSLLLLAPVKLLHLPFGAKKCRTLSDFR